MRHGLSAEASVTALKTDLNEGLGKLYCIHGFTASAAMQVTGSVVKPLIVVRCYECKQTWSFPPGLGALLDAMIEKHAPQLEDAGLTIMRSVPKYT